MYNRRGNDSRLQLLTTRMWTSKKVSHVLLILFVSLCRCGGILWSYDYWLIGVHGPMS